MSNFSTFFPTSGASAGGNVISKDPLTLNRVNVAASLLRSKNSVNAVTNATIGNINGNFWGSFTSTLYGQTGAAIQMASASTAFQQIISVTNTGKGGKLIAVIGPDVPQNTVVTFRITIDGTATEIEYTNGYGARMRGCLGGILAGEPRYQPNDQLQGLSPFDGGYWTARDPSTGSNSSGFATSSGNFSRFALPTVFDGINQIQFDDTCVVEVRANFTAAGLSSELYTGVILITK